MTASKITAWHTWNEDAKVWEFNHIEDGWVESDVPIPQSKAQNSWKNQTWKRSHAQLIDNTVVYDGC